MKKHVNVCVHPLHTVLEVKNLTKILVTVIARISQNAAMSRSSINILANVNVSTSQDAAHLKNLMRKLVHVNAQVITASVHFPSFSISKHVPVIVHLNIQIATMESITIKKLANVNVQNSQYHAIYLINLIQTRANVNVQIMQ